MFWRKPRPAPLPIYKRQPIASAAVVLTMVGMFVLGPVGAIYKGMTEELKAKADNKTVILLIEQIKENDQKQWEEIKANRQQQATISTPKNFEMKKPTQAKKPIPPDYFQAYMQLPKESKVGYKLYLEQLGYDVGGLP